MDQRFLDDETELEGRTIKRVSMPQNFVNKLMIEFTDGTYTMIVPGFGWYGSAEGMEFDPPEYPDDLEWFGLKEEAAKTRSEGKR